MRPTCRLRAALANVYISKAEDVWLMIMGNVPLKLKLILFLDYFIEQWMENQNAASIHRIYINIGVGTAVESRVGSAT